MVKCYKYEVLGLSRLVFNRTAGLLIELKRFWGIQKDKWVSIEIFHVRSKSFLRVSLSTPMVFPCLPILLASTILAYPSYRIPW